MAKKHSDMHEDIKRLHWCIFNKKIKLYHLYDLVNTTLLHVLSNEYTLYLFK